MWRYCTRTKMKIISNTHVFWILILHSYQVCRRRQTGGEQQICWRVGLPFTGWRNGPTGTSWNSAKTSAKSCRWQGINPCNDTGWWAGKQLWGKALGAPRAVSWAVASNEPGQQKWPAASRAAPPGALPGDQGLFPPAQHSLLDHIYVLQPALRTHTRYTEDIAKLEWDQWKATTMVRAGDMMWEAWWVNKACSAQGKAGSRDTNILGGFQDLTGQSSEQPDLISQLALLGAGGALGTSWSPCQNELSYDPMKHTELTSQKCWEFFGPHIKPVILAPEERETKKR